VSKGGVWEQNMLFDNVILRQAKKKKQVIYGRRALNIHLPSILHQQTSDWDIYDRTPRKTAVLVKSKLNQIQPRTFYTKPAIHKGTHKVMHKGADLKRGTRDDLEVVDYTQRPKGLSIVRVNDLRFESMPSIIKGKRKTLKDKKSKYRHAKDRKDLRSIRLARRLR